MSATLFATFVNAIADLTITGVATKFTYIPQQLSTAQLPASFVRLPEGSDQPLTLSSADQGGWPRLSCELVVAIEPYGQNRPQQNYAATVALIDAINTTLRSVRTGEIGKSKLSWTIRAEQDYIGEQMYWFVVTRISGNG